VQRIVSRQACASGMGGRTMVDPEAHLPYDMETDTAIASSPWQGKGAR
jgi:hypothetical protein